jgi:hypothetical protein
VRRGCLEVSRTHRAQARKRAAGETSLWAWVGLVWEGRRSQKMPITGSLAFRPVFDSISYVVLCCVDFSVLIL